MQIETKNIINIINLIEEKYKETPIPHIEKSFGSSHILNGSKNPFFITGNWQHGHKSTKSSLF